MHRFAKTSLISVNLAIPASVIGWKNSSPNSAKFSAQIKSGMFSSSVRETLGRALIAYRGFLRKGFRLAAIFDADPNKVGHAFGELTIESIDRMTEIVAAEKIKVAIMSVPAEAAQAVADKLVAAGVRGILNFAPVSVTVPADVSVQGVDLAVQLEQLSFKMSLAGEPAIDVGGT